MSFSVAYVNIGSDNGVSLVRFKAVTCKNADLLSTGPFNEVKTFVLEIVFENFV